MRRLLQSAPRAALAILGFHNLTPTPSQPLTAPRFPARFAQLARLVARRYECVTVTEGLRRMREGRVGSRPMLAIIFDDGYADMYSVIRPILLSVGIPATSYVVVSSLESGALPWYEQLGRLIFGVKAPELEFELGGRSEKWQLGEGAASRSAAYWDIVRRLKSSFSADVPPRLDVLSAAEGLLTSRDPGEPRVMMNVAEAKTLRAEGFEIGCHSWTHPILPALDDASLVTEIAGAKARLESLLGSPVTSFCFPNGDNDERCIATTKTAGFEGAVSMTCGANPASAFDSFRLKRIPLSEEPTWSWPWHSLYRIHTTLVQPT